MEWVSAIIIGALASLIASAIWDRFKRRNHAYDMDSLSLSLFTFSLRMLPEEDRATYKEEWFAFLCEQETALARFKQSIGLMRAAATISAEAKVVVPIGEFTKRATGVVGGSAYGVGYLFNGYAKRILRVYLKRPLVLIIVEVAVAAVLGFSGFGWSLVLSGWLSF